MFEFHILALWFPISFSVIKRAPSMQDSHSLQCCRSLWVYTITSFIAMLRALVGGWAGRGPKMKWFGTWGVPRPLSRGTALDSGDLFHTAATKLRSLSTWFLELHTTCNIRIAAGEVFYHPLLRIQVNLCPLSKWAWGVSWISAKLQRRSHQISVLAFLDILAAMPLLLHLARSKSIASGASNI